MSPRLALPALLVAAAVAALPATAAAQDRLRPKRFASCGELNRYARAHALRTGVDSGVIPPFAPVPVAEREDASPARPPRAAAASPARTSRRLASTSPTSS